MDDLTAARYIGISTHEPVCDHCGHGASLHRTAELCLACEERHVAGIGREDCQAFGNAWLHALFAAGRDDLQRAAEARV